MSKKTSWNSDSPYFPTENLIELHFHLDGSITAEIAKKLAELQHIKLPTEDDYELSELLSVSDDCQSLNEFLEKFDLPCSLLQTKEGITNAVYLVQENVRKQGVIYLEIRFAPQLLCKGGLTQEEVVVAALEGLEKSELHTNLILCLMRGDTKDESLLRANNETLRLAKKYLVPDKGIVAIDLAGAEALFKTEDFKVPFETAHAQSVPITIHAGEADGAESVRKAIEFGAARIGHGVRIFEDEKLLDLVVERKIPLEMAPSSNCLTKVIADMRNYPIKEFLRRGVKVTINTDDMAICRTNLQSEFRFIIEEYDLTDEEVLTIMLNSTDAAFTTEEVKASLKAKIIESYNKNCKYKSMYSNINKDNDLTVNNNQSFGQSIINAGNCKD